ncbi:MAG: endonuclease, partial [Amycolatopsis sp.]|uniref:DUF222 domain-containing protein n=1 Tax=Amycolatopsis sp. TaxID=37632 RepID=UPI00262B29C2
MPSVPITLPDPADIRRADPATLVDYARVITREMNRYTALLGLVVTKTETDGIKATHQYNSAVQWLMHTTGMTEPAARQIVVRARGTNSAYTIDGTEVPGVAPLTGLAALAGALTPAHVDVIVKTMTAMPATVSEEDRVAAEKILIGVARAASPVEVKKAGDRILDTLDPDGPEPKDPPERPQRELAFQEHRDGSATLKGKLDNLAYAQLRAALDPLAKPHSTKEEGRDTRSQWERHADALVDLIRLAMTVDEIPTHGGDRVHVAVTVDFEMLKSGIGTAMLDFGGVITAAEARMLACDCKVIPAVLGMNSEPMDLGRSKRFITPGQRCRLVMR